MISKVTTAALAIAAMALAGCDAPLEELSPPQFIVIKAEESEYRVRTQYDPFQLAYYSEIIPAVGAFDSLDRETAVFLVETEVGAVVCDGGRLAFDEDTGWSLFGNSGPITELPTRGGWQIVARCA